MSVFIKKNNPKSRTKFIIISILVFLTLLYIIGRLTFALQIFKIKTGSSEPTLKMGQTVLTSILKNPDRGDIICFNYNDSLFGKGIYIFRLIGIEGDTIKIKNGIAYNNGINQDEKLNLNYKYLVHRSTFLKVEPELNEFEVHQIKNDSFEINISQKRAKELGVENHRALKSIDYVDEYMSYKNSFKCNEDFFGPIVVPKNCYFVLGDNRYNANDSRYIGFIPKSDFKGTLLLKLF